MKVCPLGEELVELARLIKAKNAADEKIAKIVGRPALIGHVGEFIASNIFRIELNQSASTKGTDGVFKEGPLHGRSVNVKWYTTGDNLLDLNPTFGPDFYLILSGPQTTAGSSKGMVRPWAISFVFLFDGAGLLSKLKERGVKIGIATSVRSEQWEAAEIYPLSKGVLKLDEEQRRLLELFRGAYDRAELSK